MNRNRIVMFVIITICGFVLSQGQLTTPWGQEKSDKPLVYLLDVNGSINPAVLDYLTKGIEKATTNKASCLIIQMDTPGGVVTTTKSIIKEMTNAKIANRGVRGAKRFIGVVCRHVHHHDCGCGRNGSRH